MDADKLVSMANQIAAFFRVQGGDAGAGVAKHIAENWDPRMRAAIRAHVAAGGDGLAEEALAAVARLDSAGRPAPDLDDRAATG